MKKERIVRPVFVIYKNGWLWNGISPFTTSTLPDREAGITFETKTQALTMIRRLKKLSPGKWTVKWA
jgi:hypothetical protein